MRLSQSLGVLPASLIAATMRRTGVGGGLDGLVSAEKQCWNVEQDWIGLDARGRVFKLIGSG